jgi:hypothetical protein
MSPETAADTTAHPSTLRLHRLRLGELDAEAARDVRGHLDGCPRCASRHQHQLATEVEFRALPVPPALRPRSGLQGWLARFAPLGVPLLAAAALLVAFVPGEAPRADPLVGAPIEVPDTREKGLLPGLQVWVQTNGTPRQLYTNEALAPQTRVQLRFNPRGHRFVTLAGRDGTGRVEVYGTVPAAGDSLQAAPFALTLDGTPGVQNFYAILSDTHPSSDDLVRSLAQDPVAISGAEVERVVVPKRD